MANAKVREAKKAAEAAEKVPEFKNLPVRPKSVPVDVQPGFRFVFARSIALEILEGQTGEDIKTTGMDKMTNKELEAELLGARVLYPEFMGGVVDDGKPNGIMPYPQHFSTYRKTHQDDDVEP
jgi:hypothetical protein